MDGSDASMPQALHDAARVISHDINVTMRRLLRNEMNGYEASDKAGDIATQIYALARLAYHTGYSDGCCDGVRDDVRHEHAD